LTEFAGQWGSCGGCDPFSVSYTDGVGSNAQFHQPAMMSFDANGNLYVQNKQQQATRKITPAGLVTTFATGFAVQANYMAYAAPDGFIYASDSGNSMVRKMNTNGNTVINHNVPYSRGLTMDSKKNLYAGSQQWAIFKVDTAGVVSTYVGQYNSRYGKADGCGTSATFQTPTAIAVDVNDNMWVRDLNQYNIRKISSAGCTTTIAGSTYGYQDGFGTGIRMGGFDWDQLIVDTSVNIYIGDCSSNTVRKMTSTGLMTTYAGKYGLGAQNVAGGGTSGGFACPAAIAISPIDGIMYVADWLGPQVIRKVGMPGE